MFDVEEIAKLAQLKLTKEEVEILSKQMKDIIEFVSRISELDIDTDQKHVIRKNNLREDEVQEFGNVEAIIEQFPESKNNYLKITRIIKNDG